MTKENYPYCAAVQAILIKYHDLDPAAYPGPLGLVLAAYDGSSGCINEQVWDLVQLERSIASKFRIALIGCLSLHGYDEGSCTVSSWNLIM